MLSDGRVPGTMAWIWLLVAFLCRLQQDEVAGQVITLIPDYNPMFIKTGSTLTVECIVKDVPKHEDVEWQHGDYGDLKDIGFELSKKMRMENNKAVISVIITKEDMDEEVNGAYSCISGGKEKQFHLVVTPVLTMSSNVTVGEDVTIKCDPNTALNHLDLVWTKNGKPVDQIPGVRDRMRLGAKNFSLTLQKAVEDDAGEYECTVTVFRGTPLEQSFKDMAKMYGKPYFRQGDGDKSLSLNHNSSIDLTCDALGYPKPDVTWLKDDEVLQSGIRIAITSTDKGSRLKISGLSSRDPGTYVCNVENNLGRKQRSFKVTIQGLISGAAIFSWGMSQAVVLMCTLFLTLHG